MRYLLFAGATYYAEGGARDFHGSFSSITKAKLAARAAMIDHPYGRGELFSYVRSHDAWWHIMDIATGKIVAESKPPKIAREPSAKARRRQLEEQAYADRAEMIKRLEKATPKRLRHLL